MKKKIIYRIEILIITHRKIYNIERKKQKFDRATRNVMNVGKRIFEILFSAVEI